MPTEVPYICCPCSPGRSAIVNGPATVNYTVTSLQLSLCLCLCLQADGGKGVAAYIVPTEDPHMSEYPPDTFKRREYISGWVTQLWVWFAYMHA